ncbi:MAG TPA: histidine kinase [Solirubrobacteraceae bacterium]
MTRREATRTALQAPERNGSPAIRISDPEVLELTASRLRILEAATGERRRIERELHDGVQQQIVAVRIKLTLALEAIERDPARGRRLLADIGWELDGAIEQLRSLANGIYPALLAGYGIAEALRSAARGSAPGLCVHVDGLRRYAPATESAVYFCCLQALDAITGQASDEPAMLRAWEEREVVRFELRAPRARAERQAPWRGRSLVDMRDRIAAVGGTLTATAEGSVMLLSGAVPAAGEHGAPGP